MGGVVWGLLWLLPDGMSHWQYLVIQIPCGVVLYLALVMNLKLDAWQEGLQAFSEMAGERLKPFIILFKRIGFLKDFKRT